MKKLRPSNLIKLLQGVRQPVFLLDGDSTMIFCNHALEEWTRCDAEQLIGVRLRYRSATSRQKQEIVAAALAPPPEVFQGQRYRAVLTIDRITSQSRRIADFIPLSPAGVLVLIDENEATSNEAAGLEPSSWERYLASELHQSLLVFRRRQAGHFRWDRMIGSSQQMQRIRRLGRLAVESTATVLILGEPGSGREHFASAIHYGAGEAVGALVPVECSVLNSDLIASTIQAFRKRFQQDPSKRRHTLLLKDADTLPDAFLPMLSEFVASPVPFLRVLSTSALKPEHWPNGQALAILLGTLQIELPPLRKRTEDIPLLAQMFLEDQNEQADRQRAGFSSDAIDLLVQYSWPGNLDELETLVVQAHPNGNSTLVAAADLPDRLRNAFDASIQASESEQPIDLEKVLGEIEKELIVRAIRLSRNNKSKAAELLGLTRPKLYRRLEFFGLLENDELNEMSPK